MTRTSRRPARVASRAAMVMTPDRGGAFGLLSRMARLGPGGPIAGGEQYVSWIHEDDFTAAVRFVIDQDSLTGPVNLAAPWPGSARSPSAATRNCCSRADELCPPCSPPPGSSSAAAHGRKLPATSCGAPEPAARRDHDSAYDQPAARYRQAELHVAKTSRSLSFLRGSPSLNR